MKSKQEFNKQSYTVKYGVTYGMSHHILRLHTVCDTLYVNSNTPIVTTKYRHKI